jgi:hypothetical protein
MQVRGAADDVLAGALGKLEGAAGHAAPDMNAQEVLYARGVGCGV